MSRFCIFLLLIPFSLVAEDFDHIAEIKKLNADDAAKGKKLYDLYCVTCHGKDGNVPINPLARSFGSDKLKFGTDPYGIWKTLTYGNGLMFSQAALLDAKQRYQVTHYIREALIKPKNPKQYFKVDENYLTKLPSKIAEDAKALKPRKSKTVLAEGMIDGAMGQQMEYGPYLSHSVAYSPIKNKNAPRFEDCTERALIVKLPGFGAICYDTERYSVSGIWNGALADHTKTHQTSYKGSMCLRPGGDVLYKNVDELGWAIGDFENVAELGQVKFEGQYLHTGRVLLKFTVGDRAIEELPGLTPDNPQTLLRQFRAGKGKTVYSLIARIPGQKAKIAGSKAQLGDKFFAAATDGVSFIGDKKGGLWIKIPEKEATFTISISTKNSVEVIKRNPDFDSLKRGGPRTWVGEVKTKGVLGKDNNGYAADELVVPLANPWGAWMRISGIDFFSDGRIVTSTLSGDVWIVSWEKEDLSELTWTRFATGLYEPLGLKVVDDKVYIRGRDRITRLHDLNSDGEADYYETFYNQHGEIGACYHSFVYELQTDKEGNFYFSQSSYKSPDPGVVTKLSPDGKKAEFLSGDFRNPNGMGAGGPYDWITVADNPSGRHVYNGFSLVRKGARFGFEKSRNQPMLSILPARVDSSSGGQCWAHEKDWGPLSGSIIHTSYSRCALFYVMTQNLEPHPNGFAIRFPWDFEAGPMRPRTSPKDGQIYVASQKGWDTKASLDGAIYRIRYTKKPSYLIENVEANNSGLLLTFSCDLDPASVKDANFTAARESDKKPKKGQPKIDDKVKIDGVKLVGSNQVQVAIPGIEKETVEHRTTKDKKTGAISIGINPAINLTVNVLSKEGKVIEQTVFATVNSLPE